MIGVWLISMGMESCGLSDTSTSISSPSPVTISRGIRVLCNAARTAIDITSNTLPLHSNTFNEIAKYIAQVSN